MSTLKRKGNLMMVAVGLVVILILGVFLIRTPDAGTTTQFSSDPVQKEIPTSPNTDPKQIPDPAHLAPSQEQDSSHEKVIEVIDTAAQGVQKTAPAFFERVKGAANWFLSFDTKYFAIVAIVSVILIGSMGARKEKSDRGGR